MSPAQRHRRRPAREGGDDPQSDVSRHRANLQGEIDGAFLYRTLADIEADPSLAELYARLAAAEERHAELWRERLRVAGAVPRVEKPSGRARILAWLARRFGARFLLPTIADLEQADRRRYDAQPEARLEGLPGEERSHARVLGLLAGSGGVEGGALARIEGRHRAIGGNALRASVLGANDGLLSNFSLVMGVAGADLARSSILITGLAGLLAGAFSMALGEWISVQSSRELYERQLEIERAELEEAPAEEQEELSLIYQAKGVAREEADALAAEIVAIPEKALTTLSREELGIEPESLGGSAWEAALASFGLFAIGAILPVLPYFFLEGTSGLVVSAVVSAVGLFGIGAAITLVTGRSVLRSGLRQLTFGLGAAAVTFGIGRVLDVAVGG